MTIITYECPDQSEKRSACMTFVANVLFTDKRSERAYLSRKEGCTAKYCKITDLSADKALNFKTENHRFRGKCSFSFQNISALGFISQCNLHFMAWIFVIQDAFLRQCTWTRKKSSHCLVLLN